MTGLETWDISNVTNMGNMFSNDPALISISDISG
ncbi:hypothetical protein FCF10_07960 [Lactobacillus amylovorus subsp. animalium]|nr:hypothetical protein [Lactobacillus amylovorus]HBQ08214.1 hypothetical protein [Lactobacillus sp.]MDB6247999.1 hypothetical protein [Lactobacillus amylovorus]MDB6255541.1 hypothetical protein [Lactobacillus amylovorus]MDB6259155.1 hypothetical protein [Lactobacillus amylovorus]MDB6264272.1 hypothetical protein [Lactobacillus amylovorus]